MAVYIGLHGQSSKQPRPAKRALWASLLLNAKIALRTWQGHSNPLHTASGRAGPICRRAFVRPSEQSGGPTPRLEYLIRDFLRVARASGFDLEGIVGRLKPAGRSCPRLQVPGHTWLNFLHRRVYDRWDAP
jgi:hypothetical protein